MIVIDTSALMAILLREPDADRCKATLSAHGEATMSAGTLAEALIVAGRRSIGQEMAALVEGLGIEIRPVTPLFATKVAEAYARWGKGVHRASLNFGDCFAYALARDSASPLLFVGQDFALTDIEAA